MRDWQERSGSQFSFVSIELQIPTSYPLQRIRKLADHVLNHPDPAFCRLYASKGEAPIPLPQPLLEQYEENLPICWLRHG